MRRRTLGRTKIQVSEIGFGAWGVGKAMWGPTDDEQSVKALQRAIELGVDFFDTAYVYGDGHSETLVGRVLKETGAKAAVATKVPPKNFRWPSGGGFWEAFPAEWVVECTERSLKKLGVERLDVQQLHVWRDEWIGQPGWDETLKAIGKLRREGKVHYWGVSIDSRAPSTALEVVRMGVVDCVQVIFNLFEQEPLEELFPLCREKNVGVIVRVPFDEGGLTGALREDTRFPEGDFRGGYFGGDLLKKTVDRASALEKILVKEDGAADLAAAALRFCLSFPEVSTAIPGMRTGRHVEANVKASDSPPYSPGMLERLRAHAWKRD